MKKLTLSSKIKYFISRIVEKMRGVSEREREESYECMCVLNAGARNQMYINIYEYYASFLCEYLQA